MANKKISAFDNLTTAGINVSDVEGIAAYYDDGGTLTNVRLSGSDIIGVNTNSYMLTGMIDNIASNSTDFTTFGGRLITSSGQGSGFQVFEDAELTHISFKYLSDDVLIDGVVGGYEVNVYESNAGFEDLPADNLSNYTLKGTPIIITSTGGTPNDTDFGVFPYANIALGSPITLTAGKFYAIVGARVGTGLFDTDEEAQITLRITE